jgi:hypothetical protein
MSESEQSTAVEQRWQHKIGGEVARVTSWVHDINSWRLVREDNGWEVIVTEDELRRDYRLLEGDDGSDH